MPHCQICLYPAPAHAPNCPVYTGEAQRGLRVGPVFDENHYKAWKSRYGFKLLEDTVIRAAYSEALDEGWVQGRQF